MNNDALTNAQLKHLRLRLDAARRRLERTQRHTAEPAAVKRARALIARHNATTNKADEKRRARIRRAAERVEESFLFHGQERALEVLRAFEKGEGV